MRSYDKYKIPNDSFPPVSLDTSSALKNTKTYTNTYIVTMKKKKDEDVLARNYIFLTLNFQH